jgi:hypothetical protein
MVTDDFGNPLRGVAVKFSVASGGGSLAASTIVTDSIGEAKGNWTLGAPGLQTLVAAVSEDISAGFTAYAIDSNFCTMLPLELDDLNYEPLNPGQCTTADGRPSVSYPVLLPAGWYKFSAKSVDFNTELELRDENGDLVASNDDAPGSGTNSAIGIITPQSFYYLIVRSHTATGGNYTVEVHLTSNDSGGCSGTFVTRGILTSQVIGPSDCRRSDAEVERRFRIFLKAGETISVSIDDLSYSGVLGEITDATGKPVPGMTGSSKLTFTSPADGFYAIDVYGIESEENSFRLRIQ